MNTYTVAALLTISADTYEEALDKAFTFANRVYSDDIACAAVADYEHDNGGQRVLYLEPENGSGGEVADEPQE